MKALVMGRVLKVKDSKDKEGKPEKTAVILQEGEIYPDQVMNVATIAGSLVEGETYEFPVVIIPYYNKQREKPALLAIYDAEE